MANQEELNSEQNQEGDNQQSSQHFSNFVNSLRHLLIDRFSLKDLSEPELTISGIKKDIEFRGFNLWILIFSVFICSIGLNTNSTAVVIGAMLISPLMGPIMGLGLSVGTNDSESLKRSIVSLSTAIFVAILTSFVFFLFVPLGNDYSELLARTRPDIRDVFIAIFGGLTGILAGSRKEKTNVIPGVAIATALMPPLCTAGYGLASGHYEYFFGAFYLFLINSFFIALSTLLVVRYLRFPVATFLSKDKEKKGTRIIIIAMVLMTGPSIYSFVKVVQDTVFERNAMSFVQEHLVHRGTLIKQENVSIIYTDTSKVIEVVPFGAQISQDVIDGWQRALDKRFDNAHLHIVQNGETTMALRQELDQRMDLLEGANKTIFRKDEEIIKLERQVRNLSATSLPTTLGKELIQIDPGLDKVFFGYVKSESYAGAENGFALISLYWSSDSLAQDSLRVLKLKNFLDTRLEKDSVLLLHN